ncbi:MAG: peptidylprolyl isomerase [Qipengyuania sp.]|uniref:peptidylprolyl isomerase n=1 Tax=Qipengyuania sp. TaxID=2004515 RepID=UPI0030024E61
MTRILAALAPLTLFATPIAAQDDSLPEAETYATQLVVIETTMGDITVEIETERAPVTAGNFLRYVDEDRFDGTTFYRAMHLDWGEPPNGLLQGGTQMHPDRVLDPIAHEPTTQTGLSHTDGALSMARYDPGSATGDFSIMIKDQSGLDATPASSDPSLQAGFAVFGHVVDGMDVVHAIHALPPDPDKGEGWMKGQLLADPVAIVDMRRVDAPAGTD